MSTKKITPETPGYLPPGERPKCRNCGCELRAYTRFDVKTEERYVPDDFHGGMVKQVYQSPGWHNFRITGWGYRGENLFCTAGCGYAYACRVVRAREE